MRILKLIFSAVFLFIIITVAGFFVTREALLYWGTAKVKNSLRTLSLSKNRDSFITQCRQLGSTFIGGEEIVTYQLRFLSSKEFLLEAVCDQFSFDPILIEQVALPQFVSKVPGTSGFIINHQQNGIEIQVFADEINRISEVTRVDLSAFLKTKALVAEDGIIILDGNNGYVGGGPVTSCNGYGFECCQDISQIGVGSKISGLVDCEKNCYSSCADRPVILSFNSNPLFNPSKRSLSISSGDIVEFTYVADAGKNTSVSGILDFGDGKKLPVTGLAGQSSHTYSCSRSSCEYSAKLSLEDNWGVLSSDTNISKIKVIVRR
jgi:hypothetical protein